MSHYQATDEHLAHLAQLDRECYPANPLGAAKLARWLTDPRRAVVVDTGEGGVKGFALVARVDSETLELVRVGVASGERGRGVGRGLVEVLGSAGRLVVVLRESNRAGLEAAKRCGFRAVGIRRGEFGAESGIEMVRERG